MDACMGWNLRSISPPMRSFFRLYLGCGLFCFWRYMRTSACSVVSRVDVRVRSQLSPHPPLHPPPPLTHPSTTFALSPSFALSPFLPLDVPCIGWFVVWAQCRLHGWAILCFKFAETRKVYIIAENLLCATAVVLDGLYCS